MANNRMYFTCPKCRVGVPIAKAFGGWSGVLHDDLVERLEAFIDEHEMCGPPVPFSCGTRFVLTYESDQPYDASGDVAAMRSAHHEMEAQRNALKDRVSEMAAEIRQLRGELDYIRTYPALPPHDQPS